ncbi:hypothetical protein [Pseudoalteromonas denitrificans]|uniref:Platelet-activating factor acetylhydrolase, isoform II n=1 Tax=Pseudoalteromonas denitrificans DSM 6059 TaxID=1123010 RepID=A0A1I1ULY1_9GAMM|nr:hypothetical protein [Pseudoalteromonas denitrificans]SFD70648.1 Platelet-activating factor acetylhydrolase, isoform II [Pseudoalteromonas denitrificans DSM 6059]
MLLGACDEDSKLAENKSNKEVAHVYPAPSGQYKVGFKEYDVFDNSEDNVSPINDELRKVHIKVYYPSDTKRLNYDYYFDKWGNQVEFLARHRPKGAPIHPLQHELSTMRSWSINNARIVENENSGWPVLFYSHGLGLFEVDNTELLEDLASNGFFVVSINHTYLSGVTTFESGQTASIYLPKGKQGIGTTAGRAYFNEVVSPQITRDVHTVYHWLQWNQWRLNNQINLSNVGMFGFSLGASAAMNACKDLSLCKAAANMDGVLLGRVANDPLNKPLLLLSSQDSLAKLDLVFNNNQAESYLVTIEKSVHNDFTDQNRWIVGYPTLVDPDKMHLAIKKSLKGFFERQLNHAELTLPEMEGVIILNK